MTIDIELYQKVPIKLLRKYNFHYLKSIALKQSIQKDSKSESTKDAEQNSIYITLYRSTKI